MGSMLLIGNARNAKEGISTRKTNNTKLLLRMDLAKYLREKRFWTLAS
jgi:hypothetical protein